MRTKTIFRWFLPAIIFVGALTACRTTETAISQATTTPVAPSPTPSTIPATPPPPLATCGDLDANWGKDWPAVLNALDLLIQAQQSCGEEPLLSKKYAVHFNYGASLEEQNELDQATTQYQAAFAIDSQRREALGALIRLAALPKPTPPACLSDMSPLPDPAPGQAADPIRFIQVEQGQLYLENKPFMIKGVNYYPRQAPWERFFAEADPPAMADELDVIRAAGFNTLRVFLWYRPLFTCHPEEAIPNEAAFALVDVLFQLAAERNLKLIISLNDLPDLLYRPLYTDWAHYDAQTAYIVRRYRNEPSLLAWDVRNGADFDLEDTPGRFSEEDILTWLAHITDLIRENDPHHLLTAGWLYDPGPTAPHVDILAFQHWEENDELQQRFVDYQTYQDKPLLLIAAGEHSWPQASDSPQDETSQANYLKQITGLAEANQAGWVLWTAFDFVPAPGQPDNHNFHFGLWRTDLQPKAVLRALPLEQ